MKISMACYQADEELKNKIKDYLESKGHSVVDFTSSDHKPYSSSNSDNPVSLGINEKEVKHEDFIGDVNHTDSIILNALPEMYATYQSSPFVRFGFTVIPIRAFYHWSQKILIHQLCSKFSKRDWIRMTFQLSKSTHKGLKKLSGLMNDMKKR